MRERSDGEIAELAGDGLVREDAAVLQDEVGDVEALHGLGELHGHVHRLRGQDVLVGVRRQQHRGAHHVRRGGGGQRAVGERLQAGEAVGVDAEAVELVGRGGLEALDGHVVHDGGLRDGDRLPRLDPRLGGREVVGLLHARAAHDGAVCGAGEVDLERSRGHGGHRHHDLRVVQRVERHARRRDLALLRQAARALRVAVRRVGIVRLQARERHLHRHVRGQIGALPGRFERAGEGNHVVGVDGHAPHRGVR